MRIYKLFSFFFLLVIFISCIFIENIYVNDNGIGKFFVDVDGFVLM